MARWRNASLYPKSLSLFINFPRSAHRVWAHGECGTDNDGLCAEASELCVGAAYSLGTRRSQQERTRRALCSQAADLAAGGLSLYRLFGGTARMETGYRVKRGGRELGTILLILCSDGISRRADPAATHIDAAASFRPPASCTSDCEIQSQHGLCRSSPSPCH